MPERRIHKLFPTPIFECKIESYKELNKDLENYIYNLEKEDAKGVKASNEGGWHSPYFEIAKSQVDAIGKLTASDNTKTLILPSEISGIFGAAASILETFEKNKVNKKD